MATIEPFLRARDGAFDDAATRIMGEAFDAACQLLGDISNPDRNAVADRIVIEATRGERDFIRLRDAGVTAFRMGPR
jgi:hypothetical protein